MFSCQLVAIDPRRRSARQVAPARHATHRSGSHQCLFTNHEARSGSRLTVPLASDSTRRARHRELSRWRRCGTSSFGERRHSEARSGRLFIRRAEIVKRRVSQNAMLTYPLSAMHHRLMSAPPLWSLRLLERRRYTRGRMFHAVDLWRRTLRLLLRRFLCSFPRLVAHARSGNAAPRPQWAFAMPLVAWTVMSRCAGPIWLSRSRSSTQKALLLCLCRPCRAASSRRRRSAALARGRHLGERRNSAGACAGSSTSTTSSAGLIDVDRTLRSLRSRSSAARAVSCRARHRAVLSLGVAARASSAGCSARRKEGSDSACFAALLTHRVLILPSHQTETLRCCAVTVGRAGRRRFAAASERARIAAFAAFALIHISRTR